MTKVRYAINVDKKSLCIVQTLSSQLYESFLVVWWILSGNGWLFQPDLELNRLLTKQPNYDNYFLKSSLELSQKLMWLKLLFSEPRFNCRNRIQKVRRCSVYLSLFRCWKTLNCLCIGDFYEYLVWFWLYSWAIIFRQQ